MKSTTLILSTLAATALAQPHRHAHAPLHKRHAIEKRDSTVVWVTDWEYVTETVPVTETVWVSSGFVAPASTSSSAVNFFETTSLPKPQPTPTPTSSVYVAPPAPTVETYVAPAPTSTSTPEPVVAPAPVTSSEAPSPSPVAVEETPTYVAPVESSSPAPAAYTPPAVVYTAPAPEPTTAAPAPAATSPTTSGSSSGQCSSGSPCTGDITYYDAGLGACGWDNTGSENVVALPHGLMGTQSNGNPYCGKMITVKYGGKTVTAKVVDKCMGCVDFDIDLSTAAFDGLASESIGRTKAQWWFN